MVSISNTSIVELKEQASSTTAWSRGIEKMLRATPARSFRDSVNGEDLETDLDEYLTGLLEDGAGCRENTWCSVQRHSAHPGVLSASPRTDSCHVRGHPDCREDLARRQLDKHRARLEAAYGDANLALLRLVAPEGWGHEETKDLVQRWERRRPVERMLPPMFGVYGFGRDVRYGLTFLIRDGRLVVEIGESWVEAGGAAFERKSISGDPFEAAVKLKADAEAAIFELVDEGVVPAELARRVVSEERKRKRTKCAGGFLALGQEADQHVDSSVEEIESEEWIADGSDGAPISNPSPSSPPLRRRERFEAFTFLYSTSKIGPAAFESVLQSIKASADDDELDLLAEIDRQLDQLPSALFDCELHERCRIESTGWRIRSRYIREAIEHGRASRDPNTGIQFWTEASWHWWSKLAQPITVAEGQ